MRTKNVFLACVMGLTCIVAPFGAWAVPSDFLILSSIGEYEFRTQTTDFYTGEPIERLGYLVREAPGILAGANHFDRDHNDVTYETDYINQVIQLAVDVQVTQHAGSMSDNWLLHEIEEGYRDPDVLDASMTEGTVLRLLDGNRLFSWGAGTYSWLSGTTVVVRVEYIDLTGTKPEPLEIVRAYLAKFPSSVTLTDAEARSENHNKTWIKDEMERRLWLCDKWLAFHETSPQDIADLTRELSKHIGAFLDYRAKYFGVGTAEERRIVERFGYEGNLEGLKEKVSEYKTWWAENKEKSISL